MGRVAKIALGMWKDATNGGNKPVTYAEVVKSRLIQSATGTALYAKLPNSVSILGKPDIMLGPFPLYGCKYFEVARSHDVLQYRSVGAEFLGNQKGGNLGIRVDCIFNDFEAVTYSTILQFLQLWGRGENVYNNDSPASIKFDPMPPNQTAAWGRKATQELKQAYAYIMDKVMPHTKRAKDAAGNHITVIKPNYDVAKSYPLESEEELLKKAMNDENIKLTTPDDLLYDMTTWHKTFPLVTPTEIVFDCYIETLVFSRDIKMPKMLQCTILFRQFVPPLLKESSELHAVATFGSGVEKKERSKLTPLDWKHIKTIKQVNTTPAVAPSNIKPGKMSDLFGSLENVDLMLNAAYRTAITSTKYIGTMQAMKERSADTPIHKWVRMLNLIKPRTK